MHKLALKGANEAFYAAFERLDLATMANLWARQTGVTCAHPGWDLVVGYQAVMESWRAILEGTSEVRFQFEEVHITSTADAGSVVSRQVLRTPVAGLAVENVLIAVNVFVREEGAFRIAHHQAAPVLREKPRKAAGPDVILH
jgi:ketosteroid isomerase-like protein